MRRTFIVIMAFSLMLVAALPAAASPKRATPPTIASTAIEAGAFDILVAALSCEANADLLAAVSSPRSNLTVFAPTDQAFLDLLDADEVPAGFDVCSVDGLRGILLDHIVPGRYVEGRVLNSTTLPALGGPLSVADDVADKLVATNIQTANGVIHVIDEVIVVSN